jgi:hypothetical protein
MSSCWFWASNADAPSAGAISHFEVVSPGRGLASIPEKKGCPLLVSNLHAIFSIKTSETVPRRLKVHFIISRKGTATGSICESDHGLLCGGAN